VTDYVDHRLRELQAFEARARGDDPTRPPVRFRSINTQGVPDMLAEQTSEPAPLDRRPRRAAVPAQAVATIHTPLSIVQAALASGNIEMYREAVALAKEMDAFAARKAFDNAMADAKAEIKPVVRSATGHNAKKYADFAAIARAVDPVISRHGLHYRFRTVQTEKTIAVTCVLSHRDGHFEESTLMGPADSSGSKNPIQSIGSTLTYLQRYSLVQALGLAASDDDDGRSSATPAAEPALPPGCITAAQAEEIRNLLDERGITQRAFLQFINLPRIEAIGVEHFDRAVTKIKNLGART
jgi:hypothetical protein